MASTCPLMADRMIDATRSLVAAGFTPASAWEAVVTGDIRLLVHSGKVWIRLARPSRRHG